MGKMFYFLCVNNNCLILSKGSSDGFHFAPFWKQWNALLQVNVEKHKNKFNGFYVVPASALYYPYDNYGYGFHLPSSYGGLGGFGGINSLGGGLNSLGGLGGVNGLGGGLANSLSYRPPLLLDENKAQTTTLVRISNQFEIAWFSFSLEQRLHLNHTFFVGSNHV